MDTRSKLIAATNTYHPFLIEKSRLFCKAFGVEQICIDKTYLNGDTIVVNSHPHLCEYYLNQDGLSVDPSIHADIFVWSTCQKREYTEILSGFSRHFQVDQGASFSRYLQNGERFRVAFGGASSQKYMIPKLLSEQEIVQQFIQYLNEEFKAIESQLMKSSFKLSHVCNTTQRKIDQSKLQIQPKQREELLLQMKRVSEEDQWLKSISLTDKQSQCASLYLKGMSTEQIAYSMQTTNSAIKAHIRGIKKKLHVDKKFDLLQKLYQLNCYKRLWRHQHDEQIIALLRNKNRKKSCA